MRKGSEGALGAINLKQGVKSGKVGDVLGEVWWGQTTGAVVGQAGTWT